MTPYTTEFFTHARDGSRRAAERTLTLVQDIVSLRSVVDVGCGLGTWLSVLAPHAVEVTGVDGDYVDRKLLEIPPGRFVAHDLRNPLPDLGVFDLAMSLETAEHLPQERAAGFVADLTRLAPLILFSAAAPEQGGTHHINEQWPGYWTSLFHDQGFRTIDCLRHRLWEEKEIPWWYSQNVFIAVREDQFNTNVALRDLSARFGPPASLVHPRNYLEKCRRAAHSNEIHNHSLSRVLSALPAMLWNSAIGRRKSILKAAAN